MLWQRGDKLDAYFIFKGINSKEYGLMIENDMPNRIIPRQKQSEVAIPGRDGELTEYENALQSFTITLNCGIREPSTEALNKIAEWLQGSGELILSTDPSKAYKAKVNNAVPISRIVFLFNKITIQFKCQPLKANVRAYADTLTLTKEQVFINQGTWESKPVITVFGTGAVDLTINGNVFSLTNVPQEVTINSDIQEVYKDTLSQNSIYLADTFPVLKTGENQISWTGNVKKIEIEPNWRWL